MVWVLWIGNQGLLRMKQVLGTVTCWSSLSYWSTFLLRWITYPLNHNYMMIVFQLGQPSQQICYTNHMDPSLIPISSVFYMSIYS